MTLLIRIIENDNHPGSVDERTLAIVHHLSEEEVMKKSPGGGSRLMNGF